MVDDLRPPWRIQFDTARDPYSARNALGITTTGGGGGSGAPDSAEYIVAASDAALTAERVATNTATITWDFTTPGQAKANAVTGGGGNVSNVGTPTLGQYAKWTTATTIQGVAPATVLSDIGAQPAGSYQPLDATLTALAAYNTNGLLTQTAADTFTGRTLTGPAAGITISNGNGVAGNPTLALADDLAALEALAGTNSIYYRSGTSAWTAVVVGSGLTFTGGTLAASGGAVAAMTGLKITTYSSGAGTHTFDAKAIAYQVELVGGGGGGSAGGAASGAASDGGDTTFGSLMAGRGKGANGAFAGLGGSTNTGGTVIANGNPGTYGASSAGGFNGVGGCGAAGPWGGAGRGVFNNLGDAAASGSGAGGGGGAQSNAAGDHSGTGGGSGLYLRDFSNTVPASVSYSVGAGGAGSSTPVFGGYNGGAGGSGRIIVTEYLKP